MNYLKYMLFKANRTGSWGLTSLYISVSINLPFQRKLFFCCKKRNRCALIVILQNPLISFIYLTVTKTNLVYILDFFFGLADLINTYLRFKILVVSG